MELEQAVLEAIKVKLTETFNKIQVSCEMDGKDIVLRIKMPEQIMNDVDLRQTTSPGAILEHVLPPGTVIPSSTFKNLDKEARSAVNELLGTDVQ